MIMISMKDFTIYYYYLDREISRYTPSKGFLRVAISHRTIPKLKNKVIRGILVYSTTYLHPSTLISFLTKQIISNILYIKSAASS